MTGYLASITAPPPAFVKQHAWQRYWHHVAAVQADCFATRCTQPIWRDMAVTADVALEHEVCPNCKAKE